MIIRIEKKKEKKFIQFSKRCIVAMIVLWFAAALTCMFVVIMQLLRGDVTVNTGDLVTCVGMPLTGGVLGYMIKSAFEDKKRKENTYGSVEEETDQP